MNSDKPVISKYYTFEIEGGDASSDDMPSSVCTLISLTHEKAMQMGQYFAEEDPYSVDAFKSFGINSQLCDNLPADFAESSDLSELYFVWNKDLKYDCIEYYKLHNIASL